MNATLLITLTLPFLGIREEIIENFPVNKPLKSLHLQRYTNGVNITIDANFEVDNGNSPALVTEVKSLRDSVAAGSAYPESPPETSHIVSIRDKNGNHKCAGTLVSPYWVLTPAHCVGNLHSIQYGIQVLPTEYEPNTRNVIPIIRQIRHPGYFNNAHTKSKGVDAVLYDIALLKLDSTGVKLSDKVRVAEFPEQDEEVLAGTKAIAVGWRLWHFREFNLFIESTNATIVDRNECNIQREAVINGKNLAFNFNLCVKSTSSNSFGLCSTDPGGPLMADGIVVGLPVLSTNKMVSCSNQVPVVYTRLAYFMDWIRDTTKPF